MILLVDESEVSIIMIDPCIICPLQGQKKRKNISVESSWSNKAMSDVCFAVLFLSV